METNKVDFNDKNFVESIIAASDAVEQTSQWTNQIGVAQSNLGSGGLNQNSYSYSQTYPVADGTQIYPVADGSWITIDSINTNTIKEKINNLIKDVDEDIDKIINLIKQKPANTGIYNSPLQNLMGRKEAYIQILKELGENN